MGLQGLFKVGEMFYRDSGSNVITLFDPSNCGASSSDMSRFAGPW